MPLYGFVQGPLPRLHRVGLVYDMALSSPDAEPDSTESRAAIKMGCARQSAVISDMMMSGESPRAPS